MYEVKNRITAPDGTSIPPGRISLAEAKARGLLDAPKDEPKAEDEPKAKPAKKGK